MTITLFSMMDFYIWLDSINILIYSHIYEWKLDKGKWKFPFACPTGQVEIFWMLVIVCVKQAKTI